MNQFAMPDGFNEAAMTRDGVMLFNRGDKYIGTSLRTYGEYCPGEREVFAQLVRPGMTVVEAGANIGSHTLALSRLAEPGRVLAFEPQRLMFQLLCANAALNSRSNIFAYPWALGDRNGQIDVPRIPPDAFANFGACVLGEGMDLAVVEAVEQADLRTLDSLCLDQLHLLKIDVEGMEKAVLDGAATTIARCRPVIYVENDRVDRSAELISTLLGLGYRLFWHAPLLFSPDNFRGVTDNIFGHIWSLNMLCVPEESDIQVSEMEEVRDANDIARFMTPA